jgi:sentrin-specific protease 7
VRQSPRRNKHGSAAQRKRISSSPCVSQRLDRAPSLEEISTFPPQVVQSKHGQFDVKSTDWQLEAKLDADDAQRKKDRRGKRWTIAEVLEQEQRGEPDVMELDSQGTDPMDTADDVVGETPEPRRISPAPDGPWITGQPLSH